MAGVMFLEVLDRRGRVANRLRLDSFPVAIGRALTNDVVLDDRYVCPEHARITRRADGDLVVEDLGSVNAMYRLAPMTRVQEVTARAGTSLRIGHTVLRFRSAETTIEPTLVDRSGWFASDSAFGRWPVAMLISCLSFAYLGVYSYLGQYDKEPMRAVLFTMAALLTLVLMWATGWALVNRIVGQQWRFPAHCAVACAFGVASLLSEILLQYWKFLFSEGWVVIVVDALVMGVLFAWLFNGHLSLLTTVTSRRRAISAWLVALVLVSLIEVTAYYGRTRFSPVIELEVGLKPVPAVWLPVRSVDDFLEEANTLQAKVDRLVEKGRQDPGD